tara:strand:- start:613 stop:759 length:147 start_codon:yes stop_codon:yes gene_type:complete
MKSNYDWLKYFAPLFGILFCPVTILFLWAVWTGPVNDNSSTPNRVDKI